MTLEHLKYGYLITSEFKMKTDEFPLKGSQRRKKRRRRQMRKEKKCWVKAQYLKSCEKSVEQ
jgi:hypothetical protein